MGAYLRTALQSRETAFSELKDLALAAALIVAGLLTVAWSVTLVWIVGSTAIGLL